MISISIVMLDKKKFIQNAHAFHYNLHISAEHAYQFLCVFFYLSLLILSLNEMLSYAMTISTDFFTLPKKCFGVIMCVFCFRVSANFIRYNIQMTHDIMFSEHGLSPQYVQIIKKKYSQTSQILLISYH